tara:strand:+ start:6377 stop:6658 length:282 start_codon:yes stop_codon:yes gene_type:complete
MAHRTIIEQYDYMNLVEEIAWALFDTLMESTDNEEEFIYYNLEQGDTFTDKGEEVFGKFEDLADKIVQGRLQLEYHSDKREWRSKEKMLEKPF